MSDVLSPAEQARAHRLSAKALYERNPNAFEASRYALGEIADHLDPPEPPESVESLRAERDKALAELAQRPSEGAVRVLRASIEAIRDERDEAQEKLAQAECVIRDQQAAHEAEAAGERCKRQPRVWGEGDSAPESYIRVRDKHGQVWVWQNYRPDHGSVWRTSDGHLIGAWDWLCEHQGPLIEVLS